MRPEVFAAIADNFSQYDRCLQHPASVTILTVTLQAVSAIMTRVEEIISDLQQRKKSISCCGKKGLLPLMEELGFIHKAGKTEGHRLFIHCELSLLGSFKTHSVDCGHHPNRSMKFQYIVTTISKLKLHQLELESIYAKNNPSP
ncbi:hypothetical protein [Rahnella aceris]|jgi:hypothetical protein